MLLSCVSVMNGRLSRGGNKTPLLIVATKCRVHIHAYYKNLAHWRSEGGAGRTGRHLLGAANGRKLFFLNLRENSDCNFICVCVQ